MFLFEIQKFKSIVDKAAEEDGSLNPEELKYILNEPQEDTVADQGNIADSGDVSSTTDDDKSDHQGLGKNRYFFPKQSIKFV